jgi:hypothetical protein
MPFPGGTILAPNQASAWPSDAGGDHPWRPSRSLQNNFPRNEALSKWVLATPIVKMSQADSGWPKIEKECSLQDCENKIGVREEYTPWCMYGNELS